MEQFEAYFQRADTDRDGRISGNEAVAFFQATLLPQQVLAQIWTYADQNRTGFLGRPEFYNALKLVTVAQSKRELTPDLVKAALYGPASSQIPAPKINIAAAPGPRPNLAPGSASVQLSGTPSSTQGISVSGTLGFQAQQNQFARPPRPDPSTPGFQSQSGVLSQGTYGTGSMSVSNRPSSSSLLGGSSDGSHAGLSTQVLNRSVNSEVTQGGHMGSTSTQAKRPEISETSSSKLNGISSLSSQFGKEDSKALSAAGNGITSNSGFGDVFTAKPVPTQNSILPQIPADRIPASPATTMSSSRDQPTVRPPAAQSQQFHSVGKPNQPVMPQGSLSSAAPVASAQSQHPWPRMTQSDIQKYNKVFMQVDTNRDGKITGQEASKLFLSWRLPREVLKHVWDLSDQDNDSNLSFREFCIALYLMERYREGRPLPTVLPNSIMFEGTPLPSSGQPVAAHGNASWRPSGVVQPQGAKNARIVPSTGGGRPPRPVPVPLPDEPVQQKAKVPVLEKNILDQLSTGEQDSLNKKFEEAKDAEKKVVDLEKDISEAKQKIQFFHAKMQELILYKSRCDNRLNEITEKVVADKKEAESLAKKYEEKYKQAGDVASKLTIEEATFRDIQEKKMELYRAIVKLDHGTADGIQDRTNQIQTDLEELVKALNERCKTYGLRGKPTSLVELPFGWQPGIAGAAADWDENWDKFEDEGFTYVKELTLDVENVVAPPMPKTPLIREKVPSLDINSTAKSPIEDDNNSEVHDNEKLNPNDVEQTARTSPDSPAGNNMVESPSKELQELRIMKDFDMSSSPRFDMQSEYGGESVLSGDKGFDEPDWGNFDTHFDADSAYNFDPATPREGDLESYSDNSLFGGDDWGLNPIKTGPTGLNSPFPKQGPFFDSVPSTPQYNSNSPNAVDSFFNRSNTFGFPDSVPATPVYNATSAFADSVPSTPMYNNNNSPRRFSEGSEDPYSSFNSFSRFDSFNMNDSGPFGGGSSLSRFDSMRSTRDSEFDQGYFGQQQDASSSLARFDSFRSTADSDYNFGAFPPRDTFNRFDSTRSTRDSVDYGNSFPSFDDPVDPFGSGEPFKSSNEVYTPKKENDSWKAF